jgi:hypothetical protein
MPRHPKIDPRHLERRAYVYIRQSSLQQVEHNLESQDLQYQLVQRAQALGWHPDQVTVIDDDLGKSAATQRGYLSDRTLAYRWITRSCGKGRLR